MENNQGIYPNGQDPYKNKNNSFNNFNSNRDFAKKTDNNVNNFNASLNRVAKETSASSDSFVDDLPFEIDLNDEFKSELHRTNNNSNSSFQKTSAQNDAYNSNPYSQNSFSNSTPYYNDTTNTSDVLISNTPSGSDLKRDADLFHYNDKNSSYDETYYDDYQDKFDSDNKDYQDKFDSDNKDYVNDTLHDGFVDENTYNDDYDNYTDEYHDEYDDGYSSDYFDEYNDEYVDENSLKTKGSPLYKKKKRIFIVETVCLVLLGIGIYVAKLFSGMGDVTGQEGVSDDDIAMKTKTGHITLALLGADAGADGSGTRCDTMIIADINQDNGEIKLVSCARDFFVYINGYKDFINTKRGGGQGSNFTKLNHSYNMGETIHQSSPKETLKTLDTNLCLGIKDYISVNFDSMADLIDITGGVDVTLPTTKNFIYYMNHFGEEAAEDAGKSYEEVPESKGGQKVHLSGYQALGYCRVRKATQDDHPLVGESDFTRSERQREVIGLILENLKKNVGILKLQSIANVFKQKKNFSSSLSMSKLVELATDAVKNEYHLSEEDRISIPINPHEVMIGGASTQFCENTLYEDARALHYHLYGEEGDNSNLEVYKNVMQISDQLESFESKYLPGSKPMYCINPADGSYNKAITDWTPPTANNTNANNANTTNTTNTNATNTNATNTNKKQP